MTQNGSPPSPAAEAVHRNVIAALQPEKLALIQQWREIEDVERFHAIRAGIAPPERVVFPGELRGTAHIGVVVRGSLTATLSPSATKHDAAAHALKQIGKPAKIGQIADYLESIGYGKGLDRRVQFNGLYTAMKRRDDMFEAVGAAKWRLKASAAEDAGKEETD